MAKSKNFMKLWSNLKIYFSAQARVVRVLGYTSSLNCKIKLSLSAENYEICGEKT
jgi:hypothetical protein